MLTHLGWGLDGVLESQVGLFGSEGRGAGSHRNDSNAISREGRAQRAAGTACRLHDHISCTQVRPHRHPKDALSLFCGLGASRAYLPWALLGNV